MCGLRDTTWDLDGRLIKEIQYDNGRYFYEGMVDQEDRPHGKGKMRFPKGDNYTGEFKNGLKHGRGTEVWSGFTWNGEWIDGNRHGKFVVVYPNGQSR